MVKHALVPGLVLAAALSWLPESHGEARPSRPRFQVQISMTGAGFRPTPGLGVGGYPAAVQQIMAPKPLAGGQGVPGGGTYYPRIWIQERSPYDPNPIPGYDPTKQSYELYVPGGYNARLAYPMFLFASPSAQPMGYGYWKSVCQKRGIVFAGPWNGVNSGDYAPNFTKLLEPILLDTLGDVRRHLSIDPDRIYICGFSGSAMVASNVAYHYPAAFGGVIPCCKAKLPGIDSEWPMRWGNLWPQELARQRANMPAIRKRLSIAAVTGQFDPNRGAIVNSIPWFRKEGMRTKLWDVPRMGHTVPSPGVLESTFLWCEAGLPFRRGPAGP
jgi:hypothetical protein